ncbi:Isopentenyl-diphosphate delta-isomerase, FMN-dependent [Rubellimicrobium mesophilum DSM 19309]|uniref:Isopentenyl-diphosphate delta-isomerase n=1 Tax=Rubellimicrobium mesophilum DSM 19309 TaxID=442562 RepID=A0A017HRJ5_9RHOB|nr:type 2 isopentenyl-diphosphate Delta-isomerase [Rubellimicrobium mesophilum]EYD76945.1 Isopentenyl-diphosphate delta-isomerase, FMN-dependent [Rubellimicrobium mesophilum DSM 19309]
MLSDRKNQHLDIVLGGRGRGGARTGLEDIVFAHVALPELHMDEIDLSTAFLGRRIAAPLLVSSMTGGPARAAGINRNLARACAALGLPLAVGSQRVALEAGEAGGLGTELRRLAPDVPLLANFGAAQLNTGFGAEEARRAVEMIGADALIIHLNPLQEAVQPEGDRDWRGLLGRIEALARALPVPVVAKEVGSGISGAVARRLWDAGVGVIDVAGAGGTSWAAVEAERALTPRQAAVARAFADWGLPTARAIEEVRAACPEAVVIGSGGIRDGLDAARAIRLGADLVGQASGLLEAATQSPEAVVEHFETVIAQLRVACFCTGSRDLPTLRRAALQEGSGSVA